MPPKRNRRGIYLLPTLFTVGNLFCGFWSLAATLQGEFVKAAVLILIAGVLDGLDGRIARLTGTTSEFGMQFDSLADIVSFGAAPAALAFGWSPFPGRFAFAFLFLACAAMRLARFNIGASTAPEERRWFVGMPSPLAAASIAATVWAFPVPSDEPLAAAGRTVLVVTVALLMVSHFRYRSFKDFDLRSRKSFMWVLWIAVGMLCVWMWPRGAVFTLAMGYALSGPVHYVWTLSRRRGRAGSHGELPGEAP